MRILHVTECYAGGVSRAMIARASAVPEAEHHVLWTGNETPNQDDGWASLRELPGSLPARVSAVRQAVREIKPDIVHAHSSWAGVYSRLAPLPVPVIYEPHCYKHDDPGISNVMRQFYMRAEQILARRTWKFGVLSAHERNLTTALHRSANTVFIPNTPSVTPTTKSSREHGNEPNVAMIGRIAPQKGPDYFLEVANEVHKTHPNVRFTWIGEGDAPARHALVDAGVRVTGWLNAEAVADELSSSDVYMHTASYEGFPLSILDAAALDVPIAARSIPAFEDTTLVTAVTPTELASVVVSLLTDPQQKQVAHEANATLIGRMNDENLRASLIDLYELNGAGK